jgi:cell division initiation protein
MKVTPLDIRKKSFDKVTFGGYNKEDVHAFLQALSQTWENILSKNQELESRLHTANAELGRLREIEASLLKALKSMEESNNALIEQAKREADLLVYESKIKSAQMLEDARNKARNMLREANQLAYQALHDMREELRKADYQYKQLERQKDTLLTDMRELAADALKKCVSVVCQ